MEQFLEKTYYCDHGHPSIQSAAANLKAGQSDLLAVAQRTFHFVRDQFPFGFDLYQRKASEILKQGYGVCWNKSLLLVALLRCNRIPAQFGSISVKSTFVKPAIRTWQLLANHPFHHCIAKAYLNERWIYRCKSRGDSIEVSNHWEVPNDRGYNSKICPKSRIHRK